jgi:hypothetical protein
VNDDLRKLDRITFGIQKIGELFPHAQNVVGPLGSIAGTVGSYTGTNTPEEDQFKQFNNLVTNGMIYLMSGKQINAETEMPRIMAEMTDPSVSARSWKARFDGLVQTTVHSLEHDAKSLGPEGSNYRGVPEQLTTQAALLREKFPDSFKWQASDVLQPGTWDATSKLWEREYDKANPAGAAGAGALATTPTSPPPLDDWWNKVGQ